MSYIDEMDDIFNSVMNDNKSEIRVANSNSPYPENVIYYALGGVQLIDSIFEVLDNSMKLLNKTETKVLELLFKDNLKIREASVKLSKSYDIVDQARRKAFIKIRNYYEDTVDACNSIATGLSPYPYNVLYHAFKDNVVIISETESILDSGLANLTERELRIIKLIYKDGLVLKEVANKLNLSYSTIRIAKTEALKKIMEFYSQSIDVTYSEKWLNNEQLEIPIDYTSTYMVELDIPSWLKSALSKAGCNTVSDIIDLGKARLTEISTIGPIGLIYLKDALAEFGITIK